MLIIESEYQYFLPVNILGSPRSALMFVPPDLGEMTPPRSLVCAERGPVPAGPGLC